MSTYDPNKRYTWQQTDVFEITGQDLGVILNACQLILNTEQARAVLIAQQANNTIQGLIAKNVEKGVIKEFVEPTKDIIQD